MIFQLLFPHIYDMDVRLGVHRFQLFDRKISLSYETFMTDNYQRIKIRHEFTT